MLGIWVFFPEQEQGFGQGVGEEGGQQNPTSIVNCDSGCSMEKRDEEGPGGIQGTQVGGHCLRPARPGNMSQNRAVQCREVARRVQELVGAMLSDLGRDMTLEFPVCTNNGWW